jgi:hypothetical protein
LDAGSVIFTFFFLKRRRCSQGCDTHYVIPLATAKLAGVKKQKKTRKERKDDSKEAEVQKEAADSTNDLTGQAFETNGFSYSYNGALDDHDKYTIHPFPAFDPSSMATTTSSGGGGGGGGSCCGSKFAVAGPIWNPPMHSHSFLDHMMTFLTKGHENETRVPFLSTKDKLVAILSAMKAEEPGVPLHYHLPNMCFTLKISQPPMVKVQNALLNAGYTFSHFHRTKDGPSSIKTNAPPAFLWDVLRTWVETNPISGKRAALDTPGNRLLKQPKTFKVFECGCGCGYGCG